MIFFEDRVELLLKTIRSALETVYIAPARCIVVGSEARGEARVDSKMTSGVIGPIEDNAKEVRLCLEVLDRLAWKLERSISPTLVAAEEYETLDCRLCWRMNVEEIRRVGFAC